VLTALDAETLARRFAALADPVRLRLVSPLATAESGAVCACHLVEPGRPVAGHPCFTT
jgi:ArsR family transcriptional regulator